MTVFRILLVPTENRQLKIKEFHLILTAINKSRLTEV